MKAEWTKYKTLWALTVDGRRFAFVGISGPQKDCAVYDLWQIDPIAVFSTLEEAKLHAIRAVIAKEQEIVQTLSKLEEENT